MLNDFSRIVVGLKEVWTHSKYIALSAVLLLVGVGVLVGLKVVSGNIEASQGLLVGDEQRVLSGNKGEGEVVAKKKELYIEEGGEATPSVVAKAVYILDLSTGKVLFKENEHDRLSPASTTKMMTALVGVDTYKSDDVLEVYPQAEVSGSSMGLKVGEKLSFSALLYGMLLNSGNDAAYTIAANYPGGIEGFVAKMNQKVAELGLLDTHFNNPAGFDGDDQYSSAYDLAMIARQVSGDPRIAGVVATKNTTVVGGDNHSFLLRNLNQLLGEDGVIGIKTGTTVKSGENLVTLVDKGGKKVLIVMLGGRDRFADTKKLIDWVYGNFTWVWR